MAPADRRNLLKRFALLIEAHADELAVMETLEAGKPIFDSSTIDLPETVACLMWHAELADKVYDLATPSGPGVVSTVVREPIGVVGAVLPWNYPLMMAAWKIGPALEFLRSTTDDTQLGNGTASNPPQGGYHGRVSSLGS